MKNISFLTSSFIETASRIDTAKPNKAAPKSLKIILTTLVNG